MSDRTVARVVRVTGGTGAARILESLADNGDSLVRSASSTREVVLAIGCGVLGQALFDVFTSAIATGQTTVAPLVLTIEFTAAREEGLLAADYVGTVVLLTILG